MAKHAHSPKPAQKSASGGQSGSGGGKHAHPAAGAGSHDEGAANVRPADAPDPTKGARHVVQEGDSLWAIAEQHLGDGSRWPSIWALNKGRVPNPRALHSGISLVLPAAAAGAKGKGAGHAPKTTAKASAHKHAEPHKHAKPEPKADPAAKKAGGHAAKPEAHETAGKAKAKAKDKDAHAGHEGAPEGGLRRPNGLQEILKVFGKAGTQIVSKAMRCGPDGEMKTVNCHAKIADVLAGVFNDIHAAGMSKHINSFDGCYNYRPKRGGSTLSTHAWGIAVDVNASANPMTTKKKGKVASGDQKLLAPFFQNRGFVWGIAFNDAMHFQYCSGY